MAFAHSSLEENGIRFKKNIKELSYDFAMETIRKYLEHPEKFDPEKNNDLVLYLKYNILRQLIYNFKVKKSQQNEILYEEGDNTHKKVVNYTINEVDIHERIDYETAIDEIREKLSHLPDLLDVFVLRIIKDYKRREVCHELGITMPDYNNRIRRIKTVAKKILSPLK